MCSFFVFCPLRILQSEIMCPIVNNEVTVSGSKLSIQFSIRIYRNIFARTSLRIVFFFRFFVAYIDGNRISPLYPQFPDFSSTAPAHPRAVSFFFLYFCPRASPRRRCKTFPPLTFSHWSRRSQTHTNIPYGFMVFFYSFYHYLYFFFYSQEYTTAPRVPLTRGFT